MPSTEEAIQQTVLSLEAGKLAKVVRRAASGWRLLLLCWFYLVHEFRGLAMAQGMDQAQIGREIVRGHGFATKFARPLALGELKRNGKDAKTAVWQDTYNAPLPPLLDAAALYFPVKMGLADDAEGPGLCRGPRRSPLCRCFVSWGRLRCSICWPWSCSTSAWRTWPAGWCWCAI